MTSTTKDVHAYSLHHNVMHTYTGIVAQLLYTWLFSRWFYFHEFRKSDLAKMSTSIYVYLYVYIYMYVNGCVKKEKKEKRKKV